MAYIEQRSKNTYRITVSCGYDTLGNKLTEKKTIKFPENMTESQRKKELKRLEILFEDEVKKGLYLDGEKITFAEFTDKWIKDYAEKRLAPGTLKTYLTRIEKRIIPAIGHFTLAKIQPLKLIEFYNNLSEDGIRLDMRCKPKEALIKALQDVPTPDLVKLSGLSFKTAQSIKRGNFTTYEAAEKLCEGIEVDFNKMFTYNINKKLSDKTIRHHHSLVSSILSKAVDWNIITSNPADRVDLGKLPKYKPTYYDDEQIGAMFTALENEPLRYKTMVYLTIDMGMRSGEISGLQWSDINFDNNNVTIDKQRQYVSGYGTFQKAPKTENGIRTITMSETVSAILFEYREQQMQDMIILGDAWKNDNHIFVHEDGTPMHPHRPYKWFTEFLERHSLPKITYHQLRHTNASLLISAGEDVVTLSGRLRHGDKNVTLNTYSHIIKSKEAQAANRMDMFYSKTKKESKNNP